MSRTAPSRAAKRTADEERLRELREKIDALDEKIQALISRRAQHAQTIAEAKRENGDKHFYRPEREAEILRMALARNKGPLTNEDIGRLFREIMSACRALEAPLKVAFLGPAGTFTQEAALKQFGHGVDTAPLGAIDEVFREVESGNAQFGVVPVENSTEGMVNHTLDNFINSPLKICGEVELRIQLHLLGNARTDAASIKKIIAHPQALAQARNWLDNNWLHIEREAVSNNAEAARLAAEQDGVAAVAGDMAAEQYGLVKLAENIEDYANNTTRFLIVGGEAVAPSGNDKTSIIVSMHNKPGALFRLLEPFNREGVMLTRIDTRPSRTENWAYVFFIEFEGHQQDATISGILAEIEEKSVMLKILGSYPRAVI
jgi:chorismate mutase/prephenate dehydratase